ncbi:ParA family protein [Pararobbsia silviterrae]|uniref:Chromosome partitioning protein n=1 Tax=Pararobbsia silviterrae TaxID=1792498 RepID=A0A494X937_9BURK|nr:ParA family protein [Pararobbsia silviterrae]RKP44704.1 chromosome partitioning protein [Pararobbsia silviterrae]
MAVVLFGGEKGGSGKTTLAVGYAAMLAGEGRDVLLVDADRQGSASLWHKIRRTEKITPEITCVSIYGATIAEELTTLKAKYDDIVVDTPGHDAEEMRASMVAADVVVTPAQTSQFDIFTFAKMDNHVKNARIWNKTLRALVVINRAPTNARSTDVAEMREALQDLTQYRLLDGFISERKIFRLTARDGRAVTEYNGSTDPKAVAEMRALALEIAQ